MVGAMSITDTGAETWRAAGSLPAAAPKARIPSTTLYWCAVRTVLPWPHCGTAARDLINGSPSGTSGSWDLPKDSP